MPSQMPKEHSIQASSKTIGRPVALEIASAVCVVRLRGEAIITSGLNLAIASATFSACPKPISVSSGFNGPSPENFFIGVNTVSPCRTRKIVVDSSGLSRRSVK